MSRERAQQFLTDALDIKFPYFSMGKIDSLDLFGPTELMIFELYKHNRTRWHYALDIGANLGLHSILMAKLNWQVKAFEPDPDIYRRMRANLLANGVQDHVETYLAAVHTSYGQSDFVRVHNNLTGSHLAGYKNSYGPRDTIKVQTVDCKTFWPMADFAKIDCEGNEHELALSMTEEVMKRMSCIMEVRNDQNAEIIYFHFKQLKVPIWSQKIEWQKVKALSDMPLSNKEGSIFVGLESPWS